MERLHDTGDGSGRPLRPVQTQGLDWIEANWHKSRVLALGASVGSGKSLIARTLQRAFNGPIITPSNILLDQYVREYDMNYVKGREHYTSPIGLSCDQDCPIVARLPACEGCPYKKARSRAKAGEATIYNPASLVYFKAITEKERAVTVIDEAHTLPGFIQQMCSFSFSKSEFGWQAKHLSELELGPWLADVARKLANLVSHQAQGSKERRKAMKIMDRISTLTEDFMESPENYAIWAEKKVLRGVRDELLHVQPVRTPRSLARRVLGTGRVVLMSGTLFDTDVRELVGKENYMSLDLPNPIPPDRRPIRFQPIADSVRADTPIEVIASSIDRVAKEFEGQTILVHVTYADSKRLKGVLETSALYNEKVNKISVLKKFCETGGVFIAAGCAEGLDLKDGLCRVIYIPRLMKPNFGDPVVKKRMALEDGKEWYDMTILKTTIQQMGRGVRHEKDFCQCIIGDPMFARLLDKYGKRVPPDFASSITWC